MTPFTGLDCASVPVVPLGLGSTMRTVPSLNPNATTAEPSGPCPNAADSTPASSDEPLEAPGSPGRRDASVVVDRNEEPQVRPADDTDRQQAGPRRVPRHRRRRRLRPVTGRHPAERPGEPRRRRVADVVDLHAGVAQPDRQIRSPVRRSPRRATSPGSTADRRPLRAAAPARVDQGRQADVGVGAALAGARPVRRAARRASSDTGFGLPTVRARCPSSRP